MTLPTDIDKQEIQNGTDAFLFLVQFKFWEVTQSNNGRVIVTINNREKGYIKCWSRKDEKVMQVIERARVRIVENEMSEQTNGANDGQ
jgi:predicted HNH restriction endonuclease